MLAKLAAGKTSASKPCSDWAAKEFGPQDLFVLEAGSNSFELCTRLHALGLRAVVLESCHVGKHAKTYANNDKMAAARIALVYLAGNAPCVWVPDEASRQRRELLHVYRKAVADHTAASNSLRAYLNGNAIRPAKGKLELESTRQWILKQRQWSPLQSEILAEHFGDLDACQRAPQAPLPAHRCRDERAAHDVALHEGARRGPHQRLRAAGRHRKRAPLRAARKSSWPTLGSTPANAKAGQAKPSNSAWAKEAVGTSAISSSKALRPFCAWAAPQPWANGAGNSSPEKATAMSPSLLLPASSWSKSGTCSRATRPPRWKPTKASLSNSTSSPWHWARLGVANSSLVTPCSACIHDASKPSPPTR